MNDDVSNNAIEYLKSLETRIKNVENVVIELLIKLKAAGVIYDVDEIQDAQVIPHEGDN